MPSSVVDLSCFHEVKDHLSGMYWTCVVIICLPFPCILQSLITEAVRNLGISHQFCGVDFKLMNDQTSYMCLDSELERKNSFKKWQYEKESLATYLIRFYFCWLSAHLPRLENDLLLKMYNSKRSDEIIEMSGTFNPSYIKTYVKRNEKRRITYLIT